ncbi:MAG: primosomal protein N', partial [Candidatus Omnitrophota bacterium]|nr:primosomal protein N' [Candidatus Omnitrophota bacterium]
EWEHWRAAKESRARIVVGTRSAVFAPVTPLGLIIVTDEENAAYKQEQSPFYHVRDVARMRSKIEGADVIYASSAPSAEAWHEAGKTPAGREILEQPCGNEIVIVDQTYDKFRGKAFLSYPLQDSIRKTLEAKGRTVLFFNRRGFSTMTRCGQCGFEVKCERCDAHLTYMYALKNLVCPRCEKAVEMPRICPGCRSQYLRYTGSGVEKIESEVARLYPQAKVARYDRETKALPESADIIVATQAVMKYLDKLSPSLVGVLAVDTELSRVDFRSAQRVFSLLVRLRQQARKQLLIQTYDAKNYCLTAVRKWDFAGFYRKELGFRKELGLPPYWHILAVSLRGGSEASVGGQAQAVYEKLFAEKPKGMEISEPQPDLTPKLRGKYRFTIMVKGKSVPGLWVHVKPLLRKFRKKSGVVLTLNVDP